MSIRRQVSPRPPRIVGDEATRGSHIRRIVTLAAAATLALTACADATDGGAAEDTTPTTAATDAATTPQPSEPAAFTSGAATVTVGDATFAFDLDSCFMTEGGIEARGTSEAGDVLDARFFIDDPGSNQIQITTSDGELLWDSPGGAAGPPEFEVDEQAGGFRAIGTFTGRDGGVEDGELSGAC